MARKIARKLAGWLICLVVAFPAAAQVYQEAPMLAERVRGGELPPVAERLPDNPAVVDPVESIGRYGGTWRRLARVQGDMMMRSRLGYEPLVRWDRQGKHVVPGIAESWQVNDDATEFTFRLRKGMRWSDGHPFTSEDFAFTYQYVDLNPDLTPMPPQWKSLDGQLYELKTPDPYTVVIRFDQPYGLFLEMVAFRGLMEGMCLPKHYMSQFHPAFADVDELNERAKEAGFVNWNTYFWDRCNLEDNTQLPSINAFVTTVPFPAPRCMAVRNPYYWKVDPDGKQLPYIDQIAFTTVFDNTVLNMKAMDGEVDYQTRHINSGNYTLFMESRDKAADPNNHYRVQVDPSTEVINVYINQYSRNESLRRLLQDRRFRIALSVAINRDEINDMCFAGLGRPSNGVTTPYDPYHTEGIDQTHTQYDPELANRLLDEVGMPRDRITGLRRLPNGATFREILHVYQAAGGDMSDVWLLVSEYWREVGLQFVVKNEEATLSTMQVRSGNSDFWAHSISSVHWELYGVRRVPISHSTYSAPLFGIHYQSGGKAGVKPTPQFQVLLDWYHQMRSTPSSDERTLLLHRILDHWSENCFLIGICSKPELFIISKRFRNVPEHIIQAYTIMTPGYIGIEQFWIDEPQP
jgi:peptide/nickel transport system substrate-binding protein